MDRIVVIIFALFIVFPCDAQQNPKELGNVNWVRNYDEAVVQAEKLKKDVLILFQEVPGCMTCQRYGENVLSDDLIVEIIESYYVPLAIYNNKVGHDKEILKKFKEPSWNNPVLRIVDVSNIENSKRLAHAYDKSSVIDFMYDDLSIQKELPTYFDILREELHSIKSGTEEVTVSMYCFWTGEKEIGKMNGVVNTTAGFMDGKEVVKVEFNPALTSADRIIEQSKKVKCADHVYGSKSSQKYEVRNLKKFTLDKDQNYYLKKSKYANIKMTDMQAMKANSLLGQGKDPKSIFSPRQLTQL